MSKEKMTVCVDFDGVLNDYRGWDGADNLYNPHSDTEAMLHHLSKKYRVVIFTTRPSDKVWRWLKVHNLEEYVSDVTDVKKPAYAYIDDRAIQYKGNKDDVLAELEVFMAHWEAEPYAYDHEFLEGETLGIRCGKRDDYHSEYSIQKCKGKYIITYLDVNSMIFHKAEIPIWIFQKLIEMMADKGELKACPKSDDGDRVVILDDNVH